MVLFQTYELNKSKLMEPKRNPWNPFGEEMEKDESEDVEECEERN